MIFSPPSWIPNAVAVAPDTVTAGDFVLDLDAPRGCQQSSKSPFVDAGTGKSYSIEILRQRVEWLARGLARELDWSPNSGSPWDKVVAIYGFNNLDYFVLCWAVHRLDGICLPLHATSTVGELVGHLSNAQCKAIFTSPSLESTCISAVKELSSGIESVYIMPSQQAAPDDSGALGQFKTLDQLIDSGSLEQELEPLRWKPGQGKSQVAFLCPTSGTSGKQKLAMLTHYGIIENVIQTATFESFDKGMRSEVATGGVPFSHSYGVIVAHLAAWRGDSLLFFPRFDMQLMLQSISRFSVERLYVVPAILAALTANPFLLEMYDLSSVKSTVTGAAALTKELGEKINALQPSWSIIHAWGLTETCVIATFTSAHDVWHGSSGSVFPGCELRLLKFDGNDVQGYEEEGEVLFKSPNLFVGYLGEEEATRNTLDADGWLHTGDVGLVRMGPNGSEHLFIRDRLKDMIKVKGMQVVPSDIESLLVTHPAVHEAAVVGVPDDLAGERPRAFIVRSSYAMADVCEEELRDMIDDLVEDCLAETHWLNGNIEFIKEIPRSQNGKVLKRELRSTMASKSGVSV